MYMAGLQPRSATEGFDGESDLVAPEGHECSTAVVLLDRIF